MVAMAKAKQAGKHWWPLLATTRHGGAPDWERPKKERKAARKSRQGHIIRNFVSFIFLWSWSVGKDGEERRGAKSWCD